jgi:hypothetical protein
LLRIEDERCGDSEHRALGRVGLARIPHSLCTWALSAGAVFGLATEGAQSKRRLCALSERRPCDASERERARASAFTRTRGCARHAAVQERRWRPDVAASRAAACLCALHLGAV